MLARMVGWCLAAGGILSLLAIGIGALLIPRTASAQYGIVLDDPRALAFVRAMGVRDLSLGLVLGVLAARADRAGLGWAMLALMPVALLDLAVVSADQRAVQRGHSPGTGAWARVLHAAGVVGLLVAAMALFAGV